MRIFSGGLDFAAALEISFRWELRCGRDSTRHEQSDLYYHRPGHGCFAKEEAVCSK